MLACAHRAWCEGRTLSDRGIMGKGLGAHTAMGKTMHKALRVKTPVAHGWPKSMESHTMGQGTL